MMMWYWNGAASWLGWMPGLLTMVLLSGLAIWALWFLIERYGQNEAGLQSYDHPAGNDEHPSAMGPPSAGGR